MGDRRSAPKSIAIFSPQLNPVGTERVMFNLALGFVRHGYTVDLLRTGTEWERPPVSSTGLRIFDLGFNLIAPVLPSYGKLFRVSMFILMMFALPALVLYLRRERPVVLLAGLAPAVALLASALARAETRVVVSVQGWPYATSLRGMLWRFLYSRSAGVIAPSEGVAEAVSQVSGIDRHRVAVIPNPVIDDSIMDMAKEPVEDAGFHQYPVILGAGRLTAQKDFGTLIRAFARVREEIDAMLVILGEGEERKALESLVRELGLDDFVAMPGHADNPYKYMARASVFALSSLWEGPGHVLIETLALGVPVVATDCPSGPRESLLDGEAGLLVPMGDSETLGNAILEVLRHPEEAARRTQRGIPSVSRFHSDNVVWSYLRLIASLNAPGELAQARSK